MRIVACAVLALGASLWVAPAAASQRLGLIGGSKPCRSAIRELIDPDVRVAERDTAPGRPSSSDPDALERWIAASVRAGSVDLVLVVDVVDRSTIRVLAFHDAEMVGLRMVETGRSCQITGRTASLTRAWIHRRLHPGAPVAVAAASARAPTPTPTPAPSAAPLPVARRDPEPPARPAPEAHAAREPDEPDDPEGATAASHEPAPPPTDSGELWTEAEDGHPDEVAPLSPVASTVEPEGWLRVTLSLDLVSHDFVWVDPKAADTRELRFDLMPTPRLGVELRPLDGIAPELLTPITAILGYRRTFGLTARRSEGGPDHATEFSDFEIGVAYPIALELEGHPFTLRPALSLRDVRLVLDAADDGSEELELPDVSYTALSPSLLLDAQVRGRVHVQARAAYQLVVDVGGPIGAVSASSRHGFVFGGGIALELEDGFSLSVGLEWLRYALRFEDTTRAEGVDDETLSVSAGLVYRR